VRILVFARWGGPGIAGRGEKLLGKVGIARIYSVLNGTTISNFREYLTVNLAIKIQNFRE